MLAEDREAKEEEGGVSDKADDREDGEHLLFAHLLRKDRVKGLRGDVADDVDDGDQGRGKATLPRTITEVEVEVIEANTAGQDARGKVIKEHRDDGPKELFVLPDDLEEVEEVGVFGDFFLFGVAFLLFAEEEDEGLGDQEEDGDDDRDDAIHPASREAHRSEGGREEEAGAGHQEAADGGAEGDAARQGSALTFVIGEGRKHRPVADVVHREEEVPEEVEGDHAADEGPAIGHAFQTDQEHEGDGDRVADRADQDPGTELAGLEMDFLDDEAHDRVVDAIPDESDHHRDGDDAILGRIDIRVAA